MPSAAPASPTVIKTYKEGFIASLRSSDDPEGYFKRAMMLRVHSPEQLKNAIVDAYKEFATERRAREGFDQKLIDLGGSFNLKKTMEVFKHLDTAEAELQAFKHAFDLSTPQMRYRGSPDAPQAAGKVSGEVRVFLRVG